MIKSIRDYVLKHPLLLAFVSFIIGYIGINFAPIYDPTSLRIVLSVIMLAIIAFFAGKETLKFDMGGIKQSFKIGYYAIIVDFLLFMIQIVPLILFASGSISSYWYINIIQSAILCVFVGIFEECLFRGIIFNSFLAKMGDTKSGIISAMVISSLIFGMVHILAFFFEGNAITITSLSQALLKTLQTGMFGFLLCGIYLKTKSIWGIALIHALTNLFLISGSGIISTQASSVATSSYIGSNSMGLILIGVYIFSCLISIPFIIISVKIVNSIELPQYGIFRKN